MAIREHDGFPGVSLSVGLILNSIRWISVSEARSHLFSGTGVSWIEMVFSIQPCGCSNLRYFLASQPSRSQLSQFRMGTWFFAELSTLTCCDVDVKSAEGATQQELFQSIPRWSRRIALSNPSLGKRRKRFAVTGKSLAVIACLKRTWNFFEKNEAGFSDSAPK